MSTNWQNYLWTICKKQIKLSCKSWKLCKTRDHFFPVWYKKGENSVRNSLQHVSVRSRESRSRPRGQPRQTWRYRRWLPDCTESERKAREQHRSPWWHPGKSESSKEVDCRDESKAAEGIDLTRKTEIEGRTFFDYRNGAFLCEDCIEEGCREINGITLVALQKAEKGELDDNHQGTKKALKLLEFYILNRAEESLNSLSELNKICL